MTHIDKRVRINDSTIIMFFTGFHLVTFNVANLTGGKLFNFYGVSVSAGAIAYMACVGSSDVLVDIYGPKIGYKLIKIGMVMMLVVLIFYQIALRVPPIPEHEWIQQPFEIVFASSSSIIVASYFAYPITESFEIYLWKKIKTVTQKKHMWLRNSMVAISSQLLDSTIFFNLAYFIVPTLMYGKSSIPYSSWLFIMKGAWLYGLWKAIFIGTLDYPILRFIIPWIREHRISDIPELEPAIKEEEWRGKW